MRGQWLTVEMAKAELTQLKEEGREIGAVVELLERIEAAKEPGLEELEEFFEAAAQAPVSAGWAYVEPSELEEIRRAGGQVEYELSPPGEQELEERLLGAWLGRCAGCMLGKPVEPRTWEEMQRLLEAMGKDELDDYFAPIDPPPEGIPYPPPDSPLLAGNIRYAARDDDTDYTVLGLHILEEIGPQFTPQDVAVQWLEHFAYRRVYTAERVAYRNFVIGIWPPESANYCNPYREWIGAQIRADIWGYVAPGRPELAAEMAWRDACISHTKNGIYGEMFFAALIAACLACDDLRAAVDIAVTCIPAQSRLAEAVRDCMRWAEEEDDWRRTRERIEEKYGCYNHVHTINNAAAVLMALLYSGGDFGRAIGIAVMGGWDRDCTGATAGSVMGALLGAEKIPEKWTAPLQDTLHTCFGEGMSTLRISELARRTARMALEVLGE